jgi:hypothetical protein
LEFDLDVSAPVIEGHYRFQPVVVQEGIRWLEADTSRGEFATRISAR